MSLGMRGRLVSHRGDCSRGRRQGRSRGRRKTTGRNTTRRQRDCSVELSELRTDILDLIGVKIKLLTQNTAKNELFVVNR